ncbi:DeoR/GlpR family DNA-binding transcription regulator [Variovorax ginsengisoli]|uniref:DeoR/GlpR family transcriptional regulator of sugar metabolism n=1 Tax=Variovorax ginsengisoli TaxID=363844 RepID=A0ABT9SEI5_9BURK|nr:DeoR/GlpR family DNA-binding transcription regulator [Variovorax ginsengisoli]MDP9902786.1 DeoR/GlpR family transcriptional regulator of sugar metabolism [Variovorax ginsengisoli]
MLREERHLRIRSLLATFTRLSVERIVQDLDVSRETVRRDLLELEGHGALRRVHGGAVATGPAPEPPLAARLVARQKEKRAIAKAAVGLLQAGQTIFLDAGSTTSILADEIATLSGMTILTNSLAIALKLASADADRASRNDVRLLGGQIDVKTQATHGDSTLEDIRRYRADVALLSPVSLHAQHGAMSFEHHEASVARAMADQSRQRMILADHSKIGQLSRVSYARCADIDVLVTDAGARSVPALAALRKACVQVRVA